jgi:predicted permease
MNRRKRMLADLEQDIRAHIAVETQDNIARGMSPEEAHYAALRKFGNVSRVQEETRELWSFVWLEQLLQDLRFGLRTLRKSPGFTAVAIITLAIGIGANIGVFSVVNATLLRPLPFHDPSRLASLHQFIPPHDSARQFEIWRTQSAYLADAALVEDIIANLGGTHEAQRARVAQTSWNFFTVLGAQPILGRTFAPDEEVNATGFGLPGPNAVAVISYGLWQQLFAGDAKALGATIRVDGNPLTIIGVAPPGFDYPPTTVLWKPAAFAPGNNGWATVARLKPGVTWPQAHAAFSLDADHLNPNRATPTGLSQLPEITSLQAGLAGPARKSSLLLMAGVVLILLIACVNVANLLIARTADRAPEFAMRSALGASRARLAQQLLTECLLLSLAAAAAGSVVALWTTSVATKLQPPPLAAQSYSILDARVLAFAALATIITGLLFGALPALYASGVCSFGSSGPHASPARSPRARVIREALIAAQVMLTIILLAASVSVGRAFINLTRIDRGFDAQGLITLNVALDGTTHQGAHRQLAYFEQSLDRLRRIPAVRAASATEFLPLYATSFVGGPFGIDKHPAALNSTMIPVLSDYFQTMGDRMLFGREFTDAEVRSGAKVAVVNERFAAEFGAPADALGRQLTMDNDARWKIVGVAKGMNYGAETADDWRPAADTRQVFVPADAPGGFFSTIVVRVNGRAEDYLPVVRDTLRSVDDQVPVFGVKTMEQRLADALIRPKFYGTAVLIFAGFALLLAVIGIYGVVSYAVSQRTKELGVRMALGAMPVQLRGILLLQGLLTVAAGAIPGIALARFTGRLLESLIYGAKSADLATFAFAVLFIALVSSLSIWAATRRIAKLDIMVALRNE